MNSSSERSGLIATIYSSIFAEMTLYRVRMRRWTSYSSRRTVVKAESGMPKMNLTGEE